MSVFGEIGPQDVYGRYHPAGNSSDLVLVGDIFGIPGKLDNIAPPPNMFPPNSILLDLKTTVRYPSSDSEDLRIYELSEPHVGFASCKIYFPEIEGILSPIGKESNIPTLQLAIGCGFAVMYALFNGIPNVHIIDMTCSDSIGDFSSRFQNAVNMLPGAENLTITTLTARLPVEGDSEQNLLKTTTDGPQIEYVLLSGGPDSATVAKLAKRSEMMKNYNKTKPEVEVRGIYVDFGQPYSERELTAARMCAETVSIPLEILDVKSISDTFKGKGELGYPIFRELLPLTLLLVSIYARLKGATKLYHGQIKEDEDDIPGTNAFMESLIKAVNFLFSDDRFSIQLMLRDYPKTVVFEIAQEIGMPLERTVSCLKGNGDQHCGACRACIRRKNAFQESGYNQTKIT